MKHRLQDDAPLLELLFEFAQRMNERGKTLRVIGGLAMYFWHREQASPPRTTEDIDCAFPCIEWPSEQEARPRILEVVDILNELGLERAEGPESRASRTARFTYQRPGEQRKVELLCGALPFGAPSRRPPAWRLLQTDGGGTIYASRLAWLDLVPEWIDVSLSRGEGIAGIQIPDLAGLMLLKLKAVVDTLQRCDEETAPDKRSHEIGRVERHLGDLLDLHAWASITGGTFRTYAAARDASPEVRIAVEALRTRAVGKPPDESLGDLFERLREIAPEL